MSLWTFKEVSEMLQCSPQNIYQKKGKLKVMGGIETDIDGKEKINDTGYNYLLRQRQATMETNSNNLNNTCLNSIENAENTGNSSIKQDFIFEFLQRQVEDLQKQVAEEKEQKKYWQDLYIKQSEDFKKLAFPPMLDTEEGNKQTEEKHKKRFWARLFN
jgi:hypothetical protein